jgi:thiamine biosynthesis lipoprotein
MKKSLIIFIIIVIFLSFALTACTNENPYLYTNYEYFGTVLKSALYTKNSTFMSWSTETENTICAINDKFSDSIENSDIYNFNLAKDNEYVEVGKETFDLVSLAKEIYSLTSGAYNPCVYYLVDLWGFSERFSSDEEMTEIYDREWVDDGSTSYLPLPDSNYIEGFMSLSDFDKVKCSEEEGKYYLVKENTLVTIDGNDYYTKIDLGGLIKGYAVDSLALLANDMDITKGYINYGTSSIALLKNSEDTYWDLTLTNPDYDENSQSEVFLNIKAMDTFVSTSGDYEKYYEIDNIRYSHIIDSSTGYPINNNVCSATVLCGSACLADMLSTAICVMGRDNAIEFMESSYCIDNNIRCIMTYRADEKIEVITSSNLGEVTILDDEFYLS